jgi:hypothetical protein
MQPPASVSKAEAVPERELAEIQIEPPTLDEGEVGMDQGLDDGAEEAGPREDEIGYVKPIVRTRAG